MGCWFRWHRVHLNMHLSHSNRVVARLRGGRALLAEDNIHKVTSRLQNSFHIVAFGWLEGLPWDIVGPLIEEGDHFENTGVGR